MAGPEKNFQAQQVVIHALSTYPQPESEENSYLIAWDIVKPDCRVSISELASILPNARWCQESINTTHQIFGVNYRLSEDEARIYVLRFAIHGIDCVRRITKEQAGFYFPEDLEGSVGSKKNDSDPFSTVIDYGKSQILQNFLNDHMEGYS